MNSLFTGYILELINKSCLYLKYTPSLKRPLPWQQGISKAEPTHYSIEAHVSQYVSLTSSKYIRIVQWAYIHTYFTHMHSHHFGYLSCIQPLLQGCESSLHCLCVLQPSVHDPAPVCTVNKQWLAHETISVCVCAFSWNECVCTQTTMCIATVLAFCRRLV